jgi:hypothetical protein
MRQERSNSPRQGARGRAAHSVLEIRYRELRVTKADETIEDGAAQLLKAPAAAIT